MRSKRNSPRPRALREPIHSDSDAYLIGLSPGQSRGSNIPLKSGSRKLSLMLGALMKYVYRVAIFSRDSFGLDVKDFLNRLRTKNLCLRPLRNQKPFPKKNESSDVPRNKIEVVRRDDNSLSLARERFT
jgi:hypothetical protein